MEELLKAVKAGSNHFHILLNYGIRSSKYISCYETKVRKTPMFEIFNEIDGSTQSLTAKQIMSKSHSNIGEAMKKKSFFQD